MKSELARQNTLFSRLYTITCSVLILAYLMEAINGTRSFGYFAFVAAILLFSVITTYIIKHNNPESKLLRHIMSYPYAIFYVFAIWTTTLSLEYLYVIPIFILLTIFYDSKYSTRIAIGACIINVVNVIYCFVNGKNSTNDIARYEIQLALIFMVCIYSIITSRFTVAINDEKLALLNKEKANIANTSATIITTAQEMTSAITDTVTQMDALKNSISTTKSGMNDINNGIADTASAVQEQLYMTEDIQKQIVLVNETSQAIADRVKNTKEAIDDETKIMTQMMNYVKQ